MNETQNIKDIGQYIEAQKVLFSKEIKLFENWNWNFKEHVRKASLYMHSQLMNGKDDWTPVKNIMRPILLLQERAEGFDLKDITIFIEESSKYFKSFLIKTFFKKWARENHLDTVIDAMVHSFVVFGAALLKNVNDVRPEVVELKTISFGDQRDLLAHPFGIQHDFAPSELLKMADSGWGSKANGADITIEDLIILSQKQKKSDDYSGIPVEEVHGYLPESFFVDGGAKDKFSLQLYIVSFYTKENNEKQYVTLFKGKESKLPFKLIKRDPIAGRALGFGGAEELEEPQVWVNYDMIHKKNFGDSASKTLFKATGPTAGAIAQKNDVNLMKNNQIIDVGVGNDLNQIDTFPRNAAYFDKSTQEWEAHAQQLGSANDAIMGESPSSGTPFKLQELVTREAHSLHEYRRGQLATFWDEVMQDWIVPYIAKEISKDQEFLAELDLEDLQYIQDAVVTCETNNFIKEKVLNGQLINPDDVAGYKEIVKGQFRKQGNKHFVQILKGEMKNAPITIKTNVVGKQADLYAKVDKIVNIIREIGLNAPLLQNKGFAALINQAIELSGMDPVDFTDFIAAPAQQQAPMPQGTPQGQPSPMPQPQLAAQPQGY